MLLPIVDTLAATYPKGSIDILVNERGRRVLTGRTVRGRVLGFNKRALFASHGPLRTIFELRRGTYDLAIDASNPTDPSVTQALLVRSSGARHTVGPAQMGFERLFSAPVLVENDGRHEIDLRLAVLKPIPELRIVSTMVFSPPEAPPTEIMQWFAELVGRPFGVINVGARIESKQVPRTIYANAAHSMKSVGWTPVLTYGPKEETLARKVAENIQGAIVAPPTDIPSLAFLMGQSRAVVSADTGPMHLAVACGTPTCGLFISTNVARYGYTIDPHQALRVSPSAPDDAVKKLDAWIKKRSSA